MPIPKHWVQRVTVTLTMDCREDLPTALLEWMREALEAHAQQAFGADYKPKSITPAPPARQTRLYKEPPLNFPLKPNITSVVSAKRVSTRFVDKPTLLKRLTEGDD